MKKSVIITIAAAMILSMAGCSDSAKGTAGKDISVVSQKEPGNSAADTGSSRSDPSSKDDRLTPAITEAEYIIKSDYNDFT